MEESQKKWTLTAFTECMFMEEEWRETQKIYALATYNDSRDIHVNLQSAVGICVHAFILKDAL